MAEPPQRSDPADPFADFVAAHAGPAPNVTALVPGDRVVVFTQALLPGGAERQWVYLACGLKALGYDVTLVASFRKDDPAGYGALLEMAGVGYIGVSEPLSGPIEDDPLTRLEGGVLGPGHLAKVADQFRALAPKAVFAQMDIANLTAGLAGLMADVPAIVLSFRNFSPPNIVRRRHLAPALWLGYRALLDVPRFALTGNFHAASLDYLHWLGRESLPVATIPNAVDRATFAAPAPERIALLRDELGLEADTPVVLGVFRLTEQKNPDDFLSICFHIAMADPEAVFLLCGRGPLEPDLSEMAETLGLGDRIRFLGARPDVQVLMHLASLLLHPARIEGMPNVVLEALLCGLPVVATPVGAIPDLVADGDSGRLCAVGDIEAMAEACLDILGDPHARRRLAQGARRVGERLPDAKAMAAGYAEVAAGLIERLGSSGDPVGAR